MTWLYMVQADNGPIKVGYTTNVLNRVRAFQASSPNVISVILVVRGGCWLEAKLKRRWRDHQMWGEWFRPHASILSDIEALKSHGAKAFLCEAEMLFDGNAPLHRIARFYGFGEELVREWIYNGMPDDAARTVARICPPIQACTDHPGNLCEVPPHHPINEHADQAFVGTVHGIKRRKVGRKRAT